MYSLTPVETRRESGESENFRRNRSLEEAAFGGVMEVLILEEREYPPCVLCIEQQIAEYDEFNLVGHIGGIIASQMKKSNRDFTI